jgi:hypothetical protein
MLAFIAKESGWADTITFQDLGDTLSVDTTSTRFGSQCNVGGENCSGFLEPPPGATIAFLIPGTFFLDIAEPNTSPQIVSDELETFIPTTGDFAFLFFSSDNDSTPLGFCVSPTGCQMTENGDLQLAEDLTWAGPSGLTTDEIFFRSDVADVPEPSSMLLTFAILMLFGVQFYKSGTWSAN